MKQKEAKPTGAQLKIGIASQRRGDVG